MTNREKFKMVFGKNIHWSNSIEPQMLALKSAHIDGIDCMEEWLNAEYREPTTEQTISLDRVKQAREKIENRSTYDGIYTDRADVLEILDKLIAEGK